MLGLRPFRDELRDLLMRAAERGLTPVDLAALADAHRRPVWASAARLYEEYLDVVQLRAGTPDLGARLDPAVVVDEAAQALLTWEDEVPGAVRPRWRLVVVDDHQESTSATARLLRVLADDGARRAAAGGPGRGRADVPRRDAVAGRAGRPARGRDPASSVRARSCCGRRGGTTPGCGRWSGGSRSASGRSAPCSTGGRSPARPGDGDVRVAVLPSTAQEAAFVAHALRSAHVERGVAWSEMAVVARSGAQVTALRRALTGASVPVSVLGSDVPLREEPAARPLLDAMRVCVGAAALDAATAARLACSPLGGLDTVGLRRVRRALRAQELARGRRPHQRRAARRGARVRTTPPLVPAAARPVARLARVLAAGRRAAAVAGADAQTVLWALWSAAEQAEPWRRSALAGGAAGERADRDLDAVLALFRAAETFVDRMPRSTPGAFVDWLQAQDLPSDSLAARARRASVQVLTPAGAAGREWDLVVVAGVQEGAWPDLRLRDSLLGAQALVDLVAGRAVPGAADDAETAAAARDAVLADELRSFVVACSRARRSLLVTAVDDADQQPSPFLELVDPSDDEGETAAHERARAAGPARPRRAAAGAPRAGGGRRRRAGPRGGAHARAAGGGRRARRRPGAVVRPRRTVQRGAAVGRGHARAGVPVQGRDRPALRVAVGAGGGGRDVVRQRRAEPRHAAARDRAGAPAGHGGRAVRGARPAVGGARARHRVAGAGDPAQGGRDGAPARRVPAQRR